MSDVSERVTVFDFRCDDLSIDRYIQEFHEGYAIGQLAREVKALREALRSSTLAADRFVDDAAIDRACKLYGMHSTRDANRLAMTIVLEQFAALRAVHPSIAGEADWVMVPREPTDEMVRASMRLDLSYMSGHEGDDRRSVYRAMIAVAPALSKDNGDGK